MSNSNFLWEKILEDLKHELSSEVFETWFSGSYIDTVDFASNSITLMSKEALISQYLRGVHDSKLKSILHKHTGINFEIHYDYINNDTIPNVETTSQEVIPAEQLISNSFFQGDKPSGVQNFYKKQTLPLDDYKSPAVKNFSTSKKNPTLNKNFTFDNFVVGEGNKYAHAWAYAVSDNPGNIYNPLFIYGGVGLGKTHLLHAIGNEIEKEFPDYKIECISSEKFLNDFLASIKPQKNQDGIAPDEAFRQKYRDIDALLIDDIQFLSGKTETQNAFFHTFNHLQMNQKQIVLISDREPSQLNDLEDRLVSRFKQGATADITPPDFETRMAILTYKCKQFNIELDESTLSYISNNVSSNIRELEGVLKQLKLRAETSREKPSLQMAESILKNIVSTKRKLSIDDIVAICSDYYKITEDDMLSSSRKKEVVLARNAAIYLCRDLTDFSFPTIGKHFSKDHSSILYAYNKMLTLKNQDQTTALDIEKIKERLSSLR